MSRRPRAVSGVPQPLGCLAMAAAIALTAMQAPAAHAQVAQPPAFFLNYCRQSKDFKAIEFCLEAAKQDARGNPIAALSLLKKAAAASPASGSLHLLLGYHLLALGAAKPSEQEFRQAKTLGIPEAAILAPLFRAMLAQHEEQQILKEFPEPAANANPDQAALVFRGRAMAFRELGKLDDAAAQFDHSLAVQRDPVVLSDRASLAIQQKNLALANKLADEALKLDPNNAAALATKLTLLELADDSTATLALSDRMLTVYPNDLDAHLARARVFLKLNQDDRAKSEVDIVLARSPNFFLGRYYRAVLLSRAKKDLNAFEFIKSLPPYFPTAYPRLAMQMAQIAFDNGNPGVGGKYLGNGAGGGAGLARCAVEAGGLSLDHQNPQSALALLAPVQNSPTRG